MSPEFARYDAFRKKLISPPRTREKVADACEKVAAYLESEQSEDVRKHIMSELKTLSFYSQGRDISLGWAQRAIEEFPDDPLVRGALASWYWIYRREGAQAKDDIEMALKYSDSAVDLARQQNGLWLRYLLFDRCRIAAEAGEIDVIEQAMAAVLETLPIDRKHPDIAYLEYDWLKRISDCALEPDLVDRYMQAAEDTNRSYSKSFPDLYGDGT